MHSSSRVYITFVLHLIISLILCSLIPLSKDLSPIGTIRASTTVTITDNDCTFCMCLYSIYIEPEIDFVIPHRCRHRGIAILCGCAGVIITSLILSGSQQDWSNAELCQWGSGAKWLVIYIHDLDMES